MLYWRDKRERHMEHQAVIDDHDDTTFKGILIVMAGMAVFSIQDIIIRTLSGEYSVLEIMFFRSIIALGPMLLMVHMSGGLSTLKTSQPVLMTLRGTLQMLSYVTFYLALAAMPLADATAMFFVSPLIVTVLSTFFLEEKVGIRRVVGVLLGFSGVLIIVQPGTGAFGFEALLPLGAALTYASSVIFTRRLGKTHSGASMAFHAMLVFLVVSSVAGAILGDGSFAREDNPSISFLLRGWHMPAITDFMMLAALGLIAACGFYCLSQAYRLGEASAVAPFEYIAMPLAVFWGFVIWREVPEWTTVAGIVLIVGSGLYILHRETIRGRKIVTGRRIRL